jgi:hypothetical protein
VTIIEDPPVRIEDMPPLVVADPRPSWTFPIWPDGPPKARPVDVLECALAILHKRGWCQGHRMDSHGRVCALGAIDQTKASPMLRHAASRALERLVGYDEVAWWNDRGGRTFEEVVELFQRAIRCAR